MKIPVIPHKHGIFEEVRYAYFLHELGLSSTPVAMKILSIGACNYSCPWCKRGGYRKEDGIIQGSELVDLKDIAKKAMQHIERGYAIRFSGGDPCCYPRVVKVLAKLIKNAGGLVSIAHNGSSPEFIEQVVEYTDFWAVDLKSMDLNRFRRLTGTNSKGRIYLDNTLYNIELLSWHDMPVEVRTIIFSDTEKDELMRIAEFLLSIENENLFWTLRLYDNTATSKFRAPSIEDVLARAQKIKQTYPQLKMGIRAKWDPTKGLYII